MLIEGLEVLAHLRRQLLGLTLGHLAPRGRLNRAHRLIKRVARHLDGQALPQPVRIAVLGQVELPIEREEASFLRGTITTSPHLDLPKDRH